MDWQWLSTPTGLCVVGAVLIVAPFIVPYFTRKPFPHFLNVPAMGVGIVLVGAGLYLQFGRNALSPSPTVKTSQLEFRFRTIGVAPLNKSDPKGNIEATAQIDIKNLTPDPLRLAVVDLPVGNSYGTLRIDGVGLLPMQPFGVQGIAAQHISFASRVETDCLAMAKSFSSLDHGDSLTMTMRFGTNLQGRDASSAKSGSISAQVLVVNEKTETCRLTTLPSPDTNIPVSLAFQ